jgi:hypothetical protein
MKVPYYCPYCDQTSTRKWNLTTHIRRRHPGEDNPFEMQNNVVLRDQFYQQLPLQTRPNYSNFSWPKIDWLDAIEVKDRSSNYQNLLQEIRKLSGKELNSLLKAIFNLPEFKG